jgi:SAM-dependent methyltransferase
MSQPKEWVKERYGSIATGAQAGCCQQPALSLPASLGEPELASGQPGGRVEGSDCCGRAAQQESIGYSREELASAPAGANLGLGCGNPLALASIIPDETVLDLGSGAGFDAFLAAARVGPTGRVIGVDITPEMIEKARANGAKDGYTNVEFRLGDIESLPVEDGSVDLVISNCVLNLVPDKPRAFREIVRVLKPGGRVAVSDLVLDRPLPAWLEGDQDGYTSCVSGAIGRGEYLAQLAAAGLSEITVVSEADAAPLLFSDCCGAGLGGTDLVGVVTSVHVTGRKPPRGATA